MSDSYAETSPPTAERAVSPNDPAVALSALVEVLAVAIDLANQGPLSHLQRVRFFTARLAERVGMTEVEIKALDLAALLHDIGKLGVPEHILAGSGSLTHEEFETLRQHPRIGAEIMKAVPFAYPVAPYILSHHERWDGKGYPQRLKGEKIPLGARVLSVVDHYDALRSDRPYHAGMERDAAVAVLREEAGKGLDPAVVDEFVACLPILENELAALEAPGMIDGNVLAEIALAHDETCAMYELAQALGGSLGIDEMMARLAAKLPRLVPFACCALFLYGEETDTLRCRFATGTDAERVLKLELPQGEGASGWVGRSRRSLVNAPASADFEAIGDKNVETALQCAMIAPLVSAQRLLGTLNVYDLRPACYGRDHMRLFDRISEQVSAALSNAIAFEKTQLDALTDPLTALPNTRFLFMHLTRELARAERLKSEVAVMVLDVDGFRSIKDRHGVEVGGRALCEIARVLRAGLRPYDVCVRYARDEFIVVLSGATATDAERTRSDLQRAVEAIDFETAPGNPLHLSIAIGAAVFPHDGSSYETLLETADARMVQDKKSRKTKS